MSDGLLLRDLIIYAVSQDCVNVSLRMCFRDVLRDPIPALTMRFDFERIVGIDVAVGQMSGREAYRITCDGRGGKREMASYAQGIARHP